MTARLPAHYLTERHFAAAIAIACALHATAIVVWALQPRQKVIDIPVRILNIKLGDEDLPADITQPGTAPIPSALDGALTQQLDIPKAPAPVAAVPAPVKTQPPANALTQPPKQFIRSETFITPQPTGGAMLGNSTDANAQTDAQIEASYGKQISLWLGRFKIYPTIAKLPGEQKVQRQVTVLLRFDRRGNVRYFDVSQSSGNAAIDQATRDMVRNANPFPPAPERFRPGQQLIEFTIPIDLIF